MAVEGAEVARAFVTILPNAEGFAAALETQVAASVASVEKQLAAGTRGVAPFASVERSAQGAAAAINRGTTPALRAVTDQTKRAGAAAKEASVSIGGLQKSLSSLTRLAPAVLAAFSVKVFSDFQKAAREAAVVFGDSADDVVKFSKNLESTLGLTATAAIRFATDFGNAVVNLGFSTGTAATAAEVLTRRAADVAAAQGKSIAQISNAFKLALEGNSRGLKQLEITISSVDLANRALALGFKGSVSDLSDAQKAAVLYSLVLERTAKFQGQAAETSETFAGRVRKLKSETGDTARVIGESLAPAAGAIIGLFSKLADVVGEIPSPLLASAAAAGVLSVSLRALRASGLLTMFTALPLALSEAGAAMSLLAGEIAVGGEVAAASGLAFSTLLGPLGIIAAGAVAFAVLGRSSKSASDRLKELGDTAVDTGKKFRFFTGVDIARLSHDLEILANTNLTNLDHTPAILDVHNIQEAGADLGKVRKSFKELLDSAKTGTAGLGAASDFLEQLRKSGQANTPFFRELEASLNKEIRNRREANALAEKGANLLSDEAQNLGDYGAALEATASSIQDLFTAQDALTKATRAHAKTLDDVTTAEDNLRRIRAESDAAEIAKGVEKLGEAADTLAGALEREAIARKALDDLRAPASERELAEMADRLSEAELGVAKATRARDEALKALNRTQTRAVNLTGLSLDQLRTTLANARATLAAQRTTTGGKSPEELREDAVQSEIDLRQARNKVLDLTQEQFDLTHKLISNADKITGAEHELEQAKRATLRAQNDQRDAQKELTALQGGETQHAKDLKAAQEKVAEARERERDAAEDVRDATAKQKDDVDAILGANLGITREMQLQVIAANDLFTANASLRRALVGNVLGTLGVPTGPFSQGFVDKIFEALKGDPAKFRSALKDLGLAVPGAAEGAVVTRPGLWQLGEWSRPEVVLPLTKPDRAWELIRQSLPHMAMPLRRSMQDVVAPARPTFDLGSVRATATTGTATGLTEVQVYRAVKEALLEVLGAAGLQGSPVTVEVKPTPGMSEEAFSRKVAKEVARQLNG